MMDSVDRALQNDLIKLVERHDDIGAYLVRLGALETIVTIKLRSTWGTRTAFKQSHVIRTPEQQVPFWSCVAEGQTPAEALRRAIEGLTTYYRRAVLHGYTPTEDWLVPAER